MTQVTKTMTTGAISRLTLLASTALLGCAFFAQPAAAQEAPRDSDCETTDYCRDQLRGKKHDDFGTHDLVIGENTEEIRVSDQGSIPFSISVDGETLDQSATVGAPVATKSARAPERQIDRERKTDLDLNSVDIQIKYDGLEAKPLLNVATTSARRSYSAGDPVTFLATTNYPDFIERAEIRVYQPDEITGYDNVAAILPVKPNATAQWTMSSVEGERDFLYVLRVYDAKGRFDETEPLTLRRSEKQDSPKLTLEPVAPGTGEDRTAIRNIRVHGGAVTVYGRNVPPEHQVTAFGEIVPIDGERAFVVQRILPPGDHDIDVAVDGVSKSGGLQFNRDINIPNNDWFYVGLADLTIGKRFGKDGIEAVRPGEYDDVYTKGRLAFYLKGKIKGEYLLTASADTGEESLDKIFRNLGDQNPRHILRNLDPDDYYPVYGDDSTMVEDAPTNGKFYIRLERGDSHVMWGNFKTRITGTEFLRNERALYGARAVYQSEDSTSFGERKSDVTVYAAQPDTLPQREEFRATGGSAYFLKRQNIVRGSETLSIEVRDSITGRVIERRRLSEGEDYRFDYIQGVVILNRPLSSSTAGDGPVRDGALGGNDIYLLTQYEYEPIASDIDGYSIGGRGQQWLNDNIRVGVTGLRETTGTSDKRPGSADQQAGGADIHIRLSERSYVEAEVAVSKGDGFGLSTSFDGGLTQSDDLLAGSRHDDTSLAWRVKGRIDLEDINKDGPKGTIGGYYEMKEAGFSTLNGTTRYDTEIWGVDADVAVTDDTRLKLSYDDYRDDDGKIKREGASVVSHEFDEYWKLSFGITYTEMMSPRAIDAGKSGYNGSRVDAGVRLDYRHDDDHLYYVFGQGTVSKSGDIHNNDRIGVGAEIKVTDTVGVNAELSYGTHGVGGLAGITYDPNANDHYYVAYRLDPNRAYDLNRSYDLSGTDKGAIVGGLKRRIDDTLSAYTENSYDLFGKRRSLTQTYGVIYTPDEQWTFNGGFEGGRLSDSTIDPATGKERSDFDRYAPSLTIGYKDEENGISARLRGEVRIEDSEDGTRDQNTYLVAGGLAWQTNENWRAMVDVDAVWSDTSATVVSYQDTDYIEASLGYAYRPIDNDRFNMLFKYSWLYDMPGNGQRVSGATGDIYAPAQRSHILSADMTYDLLPWLSVGGKYGFRIGDVKYRGNDDLTFGDEWQRSSAHLGILRADLHVVRKWDLLLEGRVMHMPEADTTDFGALAAVYRHMGDNFKVGIGYNFGRFSDDLRDLTMDDQGVFFNMIGKF